MVDTKLATLKPSSQFILLVTSSKWFKMMLSSIIRLSNFRSFSRPSQAERMKREGTWHGKGDGSSRSKDKSLVCPLYNQARNGPNNRRRSASTARLHSRERHPQSAEGCAATKTHLNKQRPGNDSHHVAQRHKDTCFRGSRGTQKGQHRNRMRPHLSSVWK